jgi:hypothetical protein
MQLHQLRQFIGGVKEHFDRLKHIFAQFIPGFGLRKNGLTKCFGVKTTLLRVTHLEDQFGLVVIVLECLRIPG